MQDSAFQKIKYSNLNSKQKENYNFHKVAGELADYGYNSIRLNDDWQGADFLAVHVNGNDILRIQLKGRLTISKKYSNKNIHIGFINNDQCYVYPHDEILEKIIALGKIINSKSWIVHKSYSWPTIPKWASAVLEPYRI